jgi:hypothetical protein
LYDSTNEVLDFEYIGVCMLAADEPMNIEQALEEACWRKAMEEEIKSIHQNGTWVAADLPKGQKAIGLKWDERAKGSKGNRTADLLPWYRSYTKAW